MVAIKEEVIIIAVMYSPHTMHNVVMVGGGGVCGTATVTLPHR